jgi:hypothetical protein
MSLQLFKLPVDEWHQCHELLIITLVEMAKDEDSSTCGRLEMQVGGLRSGRDRGGSTWVALFHAVNRSIDTRSILSHVSRT